MVVVQKQRSFGPETGPSASSTGIANKVRRGDLRHAVIVRTRKEIQRPDGNFVKFDDNACVLINKSGDPIGTRLNGESKRLGISIAWGYCADLTSQGSWQQSCGKRTGQRSCH